LDKKRWSLLDKCWNQRLDATDSSPTHSDNRGDFPNRRAPWKLKSRRFRHLRFLIRARPFYDAAKGLAEPVLRQIEVGLGKGAKIV
jgi:hypothetical protein